MGWDKWSISQEEVSTHKDGVRVPRAVGHSASWLTDPTSSGSVRNEQDGSHKSKDDDGDGEDILGRESGGERSDEDRA
jgi:hypothetical protein